MTHDHAEDVALCDAVLRTGDFGSIGLIGSAGKWARFRAKLADEGHDADDDRADPHADRAARHHRQGTGHDRGQRRRRAAAGFARERVATERRDRKSTRDAVPRAGPRHPGRPVPRRRAAGRRRRRAARDRRRDRRARRRSPRCARGTDADEVVDLTRRPRAARASSTRTCTSRSCDASARSACRCWNGSSGARCPKRRGWPTPITPARSPASSSARSAEAGTTTALVFGAHFAPAMDVLFEAAAARGLRVTSGLVVGDRLLRPELHTTAAARVRRGTRAGAALARRRPQPLRGDPAVLAVVHRRAARVVRGTARRGRRQLVHLAHQREPRRDRHRRRSCSAARATSTATTSTGWSVAAACSRTTCTRPTPSSSGSAASGASVAHCPTSNAALGSGLFPLDRHLDHGVHVALGCDVGAGTGFSLFKEGLQAYFMQQLRGADGVPLTATHLLHLATAAGASALGLARPDRRPQCRQAVRRAVAAPGAGQHAGRGAAARRRAGRRAGQGVRAGRRRTTSPACGSTATRSKPSAS